MLSVVTTKYCQNVITSATRVPWRSKYGGLGVSEARRLKQLEEENQRLRRSSAEPPGAEGHPGKQVETARERRQVVEKVQAAAAVSERRAIRFTGFPRSSMRYKSLSDPQQ